MDAQSGDEGRFARGGRGGKPHAENAESAEWKSHAENAEGAECRGVVGAAPSAPVVIDPETGTFLLDTPRTAGGFAESGAHAAGPLHVKFLGGITAIADKADSDNTGNIGNTGDIPTPATVWVSSLDGEPIARSSRLLLTHLTDVQNSGIKYADEALTILLEWGGLPHLMRRGAAEIELQLSASARKSQTSANENGDANLDLPSVDKDDHFGWFDNSANAGWRVFRLSPSGRRIGEVSCAWQPADQALTSRASSGGLQRPSGDATGEAGTLRFTADTAIDPSSAMFLYEIVRDADPGFRRKTAEKR